jgi:MoaA/NifB/PqqE/SkfB family radical SAM enzyme
MLQIQANGDVRTCIPREPIGNIKLQTIREIWQTRPRWWRQGCCLEDHLRNRSSVQNPYASG